MEVKVTFNDGTTVQGYHNGKKYNGFVYITLTGDKMGTRYALTDIKEIKRVNEVKKQSHDSLFCRKCHSYCYGDCEAN